RPDEQLPITRPLRLIQEGERRAVVPVGVGRHEGVPVPQEEGVPEAGQGRTEEDGGERMSEEGAPSLPPTRGQGRIRGQRRRLLPAAFSVSRGARCHVYVPTTL